MKDQIIEFFESNFDLFDECAKELDVINGFLGYSRCYPMSEIGSHYSSTRELLEDVWYGSDCDGGSFCPIRNYFHRDVGYNLVSTDFEDYSDFLEEEIIEDLNEYQDEIKTIVNNQTLKEMFNALRKECGK